MNFENNTLRYLKSRVLSTVNGTKSEFKKVNLHSHHRILNPPKLLVPNGEFKQVDNVKIGSKNVTLQIMETDHGYYVKPDKKIYDSHFERIFGFGVCCNGFSKDRVVFYPSYEKNMSFREVLEQPLESPGYKKYLHFT